MAYNLDIMTTFVQDNMSTFVQDERCERQPAVTTVGYPVVAHHMLSRILLYFMLTLYLERLIKFIFLFRIYITHHHIRVYYVLSVCNSFL